MGEEVLFLEGRCIFFLKHIGATYLYIKTNKKGGCFRIPLNIGCWIGGLLEGGFVA